MSRKHILIISLFIVAGLASLIYQVVWFKQLSYFLGSTTYSQSVVLATFMGGLALGSWYWGARADETKNQLRIFAFLEITLAIYCFFYHQIFDFASSLFFTVATNASLPSDGTAVLSLKFLVSAGTILFPTFLMGGTLPVLVRYLSSTSDKIGKNVAILYFVNSLGAVLGTALAGFFLIQYLGLRLTTYFGATIELSVGLIALMVSLSITNKKPKEEDLITKNNGRIEPSKKEAIQKEPSILSHKLVLFLAFSSGVSAMIYEVGWLRLLIPILSSSTYSFTIILVTFISGITIGSYLIYKFNHAFKNTLLTIGLCQLGIVLSMLITLPQFEKVPYWIWSSSDGILETSAPFLNYILLQIGYVFMLLFLPTIFMGMTLPLLSRYAAKTAETAGKTIGNLFAVNTVGTVIGSLAAGLILVPYIGIRSTIELAIFLNLLIFILLIKSSRVSDLRFKVVSIGIVLMVYGWYNNKMSSENWGHAIMLSEIPRQINRNKAPESYDEFYKFSTQGNSILYYNEGIGGTIVVATNGKETYLTTNGKGDANTVSDLRTQVSLGLTPITLHPKPDSIFVIGFGAGTTVGHAASHPNVKYAEVAEISSEVVEASVHFNSINQKPLENKKINVINDDGVSALRMSKKKFDVIISQPSNPWSAGVGNLFTDEFFRDCKSKLKPGGFVAQWLNLYEIDDKSLQLIFRTALGRFSNISIWHIGRADILLVCSDQKIDPDLEKMKVSYYQVRDQFQLADIYSFSAFLSQQLTNDIQRIRNYAGKGVVNTENHPYLEMWAPKAYFYNLSPTKFTSLDERKNFKESKLFLSDYLRSSKVTKDEILQAGLFQSTGGSKELAYYLADLNPAIYLAWAQKASAAGDQEKVMEYMELAHKQGAIENKEIVLQRIRFYGEQGKTDLALKEIEKAMTTDRNSGELHYQKGTLLMSQNKLEEAETHLLKAISLNPKLADAYNNLATIKGMKQDYKAVIDILNTAIQQDNSNPKIFFNRAYAKGFMGDFQGAVNDFTQSLILDPANGKALVLRGRAYISMGKKDEACNDFQRAKSIGTEGAIESINQFCR
jgi:spermidine synthase